MGTAIVILILAAIVGAIIRSMVKAHKRGEHPACGGDCGHCSGSCGCHQENIVPWLFLAKGLFDFYSFVQAQRIDDLSE